MSVSPTSPGAPRNASPAGVNTSTRPTASPLLLPAGRPEVLAHESRRPSIQFLPHTNAALPKGSPKRERGRRRISSPPPPPVFQPRVSFDTFDKPADFIEENSFTLVAKHKDYEYTKRSRTFLCGCDDNEYSDYALQWLIDELVDDGDEIVCLRVVEKDDTLAGDRSVEKGRYRSEAEALMKSIQGKNHENKAINLILEFAVGKVNKVIDEMINMYEPAILVVGTRGRSLAGFQGLLPGSVSKYCLQHSPVPVIVVRPSSKRDKARTKRALDPNRHAYKDLLERSGSTGHLLEADPRSIHSADDSRQASDDEAAAVAKAIGYKPATGTPLAQSQSAPSVEANELAKTDDPDVAAALMKSPELQNLDSPEVTDASSSSDDEGGVPTGATTTTNALAEIREGSEDHGDTANGAASSLGMEHAADPDKEPVTEPEDRPAGSSAEEPVAKPEGNPVAETVETSTVDPDGHPADALKTVEGA